VPRLRSHYTIDKENYLNSPHNSEIVADLLQVNPEIEIRKEKE